MRRSIYINNSKPEHIDMKYNTRSKKKEDCRVDNGLKRTRMQLVGGRAKQAQVYPREFRDAVCEGIALQKQRIHSESSGLTL